MPRSVTQKWRPSLTLVLAGTLAAVLVIPLLAIGYFRVAGNVLGWGETSWLIAWIAVAATCVLAFLLWRLVLRPVHALTSFANATARGTDDAVPPSHFGTPEISDLAQAVISMGATLQGRENAIRSYADHVTHELKSPLTVIQGAVELLDSPKITAEDRAQMLRNICDATARMETLLDAQRTLARAAEPITKGQSRLSEIAVDADVQSDGVVPMSSEALKPILEHLISNAKSHGATQIVLAHAGDHVTVTDNGEGISDGNRSRIFDPFFTTRRDDGGTGMGLAIVRRMLDAQGSSIILRDGHPTTFEIWF